MSSLKSVRDVCRAKGRGLLERRKTCHLKPGHRSDGCGYYQGKYCYLRVDCRSVGGEPLCWVSVVDHYTDEILLSKPCETTPQAAKYDRSFFTAPTRRRG